MATARPPAHADACSVPDRPCARAGWQRRGPRGGFPSMPPNDPRFAPNVCPPAVSCTGVSGQWNLLGYAPDVLPAPHASGISADLAWQLTTGHPDVVIAILDSGVNYDHEDLRNKIWLNRGELPVPVGPCCAAPFADPRLQRRRRLRRPRLSLRRARHGLERLGCARPRRPEARRPRPDAGLAAHTRARDAGRVGRADHADAALRHAPAGGVGRAPLAERKPGGAVLGGGPRERSSRPTGSQNRAEAGAERRRAGRRGPGASEERSAAKPREHRTGPRGL
jgi:subtilisin family serine protease